MIRIRFSFHDLSTSVISMTTLYHKRIIMSSISFTIFIKCMTTKSTSKMLKTPVLTGFEHVCRKEDALKADLSVPPGQKHA